MLRLLEADGRCVPSKSVVLVRHGLDNNHLDISLDQPLCEAGIPNVTTLAKELALFYQSCDRPITIYSSTKLRAVQTADIIGSWLLDKLEIPILSKRVDALRELYQGHFRIVDYRDKEPYPPFVSAWAVWAKALASKDILYRFGDPVLRANDLLCSELSGWFSVFGENQKEHTARLYSFIKGILPLVGIEPIIIVAHQAVCTRLQRFFNTRMRLGQDIGHFMDLEMLSYRRSLDPAEGIVLSSFDSELCLWNIEYTVRYLEEVP